MRKCILVLAICFALAAPILAGSADRGADRSLVLRQELISQAFLAGLPGAPAGLHRLLHARLLELIAATPETPMLGGRPGSIQEGPDPIGTREEGSGESSEPPNPETERDPDSDEQGSKQDRKLTQD